jgi:hypothetical protein
MTDMPPYEELPSTFEGLLRRADETAAGRSRSYVADAVVFARWIRSTGKQLYEEVADLRRRLKDAEKSCASSR